MDLNKRHFFCLIKQYNDVMWISYLGVLMQGSNTLNQYINKFLVMYDKTLTKRSRSMFM